MKKTDVIDSNDVAQCVEHGFYMGRADTSG